MIDERTEELASLYVLDLLVGGERTVFEAQLAADPELQNLVRALRETAGALAFAASSSPPPELKTRLLAQVRTAGKTAAIPAHVSGLVPFRVPTWLPWAAAVCFAVAAAWLGREFLFAREQIFALRTEAQLADLDRRDAQNHLTAERIVLNRQLTETGRQLTQAQQRIADTEQQLATLDREAKAQGDLAQLKIATLTSMLGNSPESIAVAVWNPARQEGVFTVDKLPAVAPDQDYELWVIDPQQPKPISGGVFKVGANGQARIQFKPEAPVSQIAKFAVSREKSGGAPRFAGPQGEVIMISQ